MFRKRLPSVSGLLLVTGSVAIVAQAPAQTLADAVGQRTQANEEGQDSQRRVDALSDQTDALASEYRSTLKQIESLRIYNAQLQDLITSQEVEMASLQAQIDDVEIVERGIPPLMLEMIDGLERFVHLDVPFLGEERAGRVDGLRDLMKRADVTNAEKYRRIAEAYQIENDYGRTIESYRGQLDDGRTVDFLRIGRIALVYQTLDGEETGVWEQQEGGGGGQWTALDDGYRTPVKNGIKIAKKQTAPDMISLPLAAAK